MKINFGKLLGTVAKVAGPVIVTAVVLHEPLKQAIVDAAKKAARDELDKDRAGA